MNILNKIDKDITLLLDNLPVGIIRLDSKRQCIFANKFVFNLLGICNRDDVCKTQYASTHHEDIHNESNLCNDFFFKHVESESTFRIYDNNKKEYRWISNKRTIIKQTDSNNLTFMYTLQDVHENKLMEIKLRNESIRAEKAYNHKSIFLANMSHEIRTPLNGIIGMLTLLDDTDLTNDQQDYISMVKECSFNLMTIINDILDYSKLEVGKITLDIKSLNLRDCIESTNDIVLSKIYEKSLEYSYNINPNIPVIIKGDSNRLKQILLNLLSNSIKFTEHGSIFLNINEITLDEYELLKSKNCNGSNIIEYTKRETQEKPKEEIILQTDVYNEYLPTEHDYDIDDKIYLRFDVTDDGCGIDEFDKIKLFKSFSQIDNRLTSKVYQGTGLGLAISKELIELMNGCIWLEWSELGNGSKFSFILETEVSDEDIQSTFDENENILKNINVLILDDNLHNRISLSGIISKWGMKPHSFSNSEEALYFARLTQFDIGLIDVCMPKVNGIEFAGKLREQKEFNNKKIPLIALSSIGDKFSTITKQNFHSHLIKPIKESRLKKLCIDAIKKHSKDKNNKQVTITEIPKQSDIIDSYMTDNNISELKNNVRILVAEDVYINQRVIVSFLNKMGFGIITIVENGKQCLDTIYSNDFDIILLDIRMPVINGEVVLQNIKNYYLENQNKKTPYVIAVTAYCLREDQQKYISMGFDDYIPKPVSIKELNKCMNKFIHRLLKD